MGEAPIMTNIQPPIQQASGTNSPVTAPPTSLSAGDTSTSSENMKRRTVACNACHSLKVKCSPLDVKNPFGPCVRCLKAKRECEFDLSQPRRRKRKTPLLVKEELLEPLQLPHQQEEYDSSISPRPVVGNTLPSPLSQLLSQHLSPQQTPPQPQEYTPAVSTAELQEDDIDKGRPQKKMRLKKATKIDQLQKKIKLLEQELQKLQHQKYGSYPQSYQPQMVTQVKSNTPLGPPTGGSFSSAGSQNNHVGAPFPPPYGSPGVIQLQQLQQQPQQLQLQLPHLQQYPQVPPFVRANNTPSQIASPGTLPSIPSPYLKSNSPTFYQNFNSPAPFFDSPSNIEVTPQETINTDEQLEELQNDLNLLLNTQKATLSQLTADVLEVAERRNTLIKEKYGNIESDPVMSGLISIEEAQRRLDIYRDMMHPVYPFVDIPQGISADEMRTTKKFLFSTIITVTSQMVPKESRGLENQLEIDLCNIRLLVTEVLVIGNKTLEILQCLVLLSVWYNSSELFHHRRYHLISSLCITMAHDLGLTGRAYFFYNKEEGSVNRTQVSDNVTSLEYRRLLLTVYFASISISLFLRRRIQVSWTSYLEECCNILEQTQNPGDKKVSLLTRLSRMLERIHCIVGNQEPTDSAFLLPDRLKYIVSDLQKDLSEIKKKIPRDDHCLTSYYYSVQAYLHEPELHKIFNCNEAALLKSSMVISSIDKCSRSCIAALEQLNLASLQDITMMPLLYSSRVIYTAGMLLRLRYLVISIPSLCKSTYFPKHSIEHVQLLARRIYDTSQVFPSNHFLQKTRLVIALFSETYLTQLRKLMEQKSLQVKLETEADIQSLHLLSQAAALARNESLGMEGKQATDSAGSFKNDSKDVQDAKENSNKSNFNGAAAATVSGNSSGAPVTNGNNVAGPNGSNDNGNNAAKNSTNLNGTTNPDLEFSYYALNDEFWSDLLMNNGVNQPIEGLGLYDQDQFDTNFI